MNKSSSLKATIQGLRKKAFSSSMQNVSEQSDYDTYRTLDDTMRYDQEAQDTAGLDEEGPRGAGPAVGGDMKNEHISLGEGRIAVGHGEEGGH